MYAPHDLSEIEMAKWRNRGRPLYDVFDVLDFKPAEHYRVCDSLSEMPFELCVQVEESWTNYYLVVEFFDYVRIYDTDGKDQAFERNRSSTGQPETDCKSY